MSKANGLNYFSLTAKKILPLSKLVFFAILFSVKAYAACPREDVSYYLKEGFNQEQIVELCSASKPSQRSYEKTTKVQQEPLTAESKQQLKPLDDTRVIHHESAGIYGNPDAVFLATAIEGYDVEVTENTIIFTRKDCFNFGQKDWNGFQNNACPNVKYTIIRGGLMIKDRDNGFFGLGSTALYISGNIKAEILNLGQFKQDQQEDIRRIIQKNTEMLKIDVRSGMPQDKVEAILLRLAG
jgi:hypothetical protein